MKQGFEERQIARAKVIFSAKTALVGWLFLFEISDP